MVDIGGSVVCGGAVIPEDGTSKEDTQKGNGMVRRIIYRVKMVQTTRELCSLGETT